MPTFLTPGMKPFGNIVEKGKILVISIFSFSQNIFNPSQNNFSFSVTYILSSANALNLDQSEILSGKGLSNNWLYGV